MSYSPLQARDRHGRWIAKGGNAAFKVASRSVGSGTKAPRMAKGTKAGKNAIKSHGVSSARTHAIVPYARVNKRSSTVGFNAGTKIRGTKKRVVGGAYIRVESTTKHTTADKIAGKAARSVFPKGTRRGKALGYLRKNVGLNNPALRATTPKGNSVRLGTSRGAGPTIIVRRGKHKVAQPKSASGVGRYNASISKIQGKRIGAKKARPARRKAGRKKK